MDLLTRNEIEGLARDTGGTHVTLCMPTHRAGPETEGDPIRWRNLLSGVEAELVETGLSRAEAQELLAEAWELQRDSLAWQHMSDGLAVFLSASGMRLYRLPVSLPELAAVGERFVLGPVLPLLGDEHFLVLALSQRQVRVLEGSRQRVEELHLPQVPESFDEVFEPDEPRSDSMARPVSPGRSGPSVYYGTAGPDGTERKVEVTSFFREVADGVHDHLAGRSLTMVLAGLPESVAAYRSVNRYAHVADHAVESNPDDLSAEELHDRAWPIIQARLAEADLRTTDHLQQRLGTGKATTDRHEALRAAREGRVDTLLLTMRDCWATRQPDGHVLRLAGEEPTDRCEMLDAAAAATLTTGGTVRVLDELPEGTDIGAVLRY
jgi:hypothetical protein